MQNICPLHSEFLPAGFQPYMLDVASGGLAGVFGFCCDGSRKGPSFGITPWKLVRRSSDSRHGGICRGSCWTPYSTLHRSRTLGRGLHFDGARCNLRSRNQVLVGGFFNRRGGASPATLVRGPFQHSGFDASEVGVVPMPLALVASAMTWVTGVEPSSDRMQ